MVFSEEVKQKYGFLLQPIKDLTKNWDVDVAHVLEDYLEELEKMTFSIDNGKTVLNFAEASLIIQGTACVWSRKVEYLHVLVKQTLDMITNKRNITEQNSLNAEDKTIEGHFDDDDEKLLKLDDVTITSRRELTGTYDPVAPIPIVPAAMLENDTDDRGRVILTSNKTDNVCHTNDFWENHFVPLDKEVAVLDRDSGGILEKILVPSIEDMETVMTNTFCHGIDEDVQEAPEPTMDDVGDDAPCDDDIADDLPGPPEAMVEETTVIQRQMRTRAEDKQKLVDAEKEDEPIQRVLEPHQVYADAMWTLKKHRKIRSYKLPEFVMENPRKRKLTASSLEKVSAISEFLRAKNHRQQNTKLKHANLSVFFAAQQKAVSQAWKDIRKETSSARVGHEFQRKDIGDDFEDNDFAISSNDISSYSDQISPDFEMDNLIGDVASTQACNTEMGATNESPASYEDLVRHHVEMFYSAALRYKEETELSQRVKLWEEAITPRLSEQDTRPEFDIHKYGDIMLGKFQNPQDSSFFHDIADSSDTWYICRLFAATLQLVNDNNFLISKHDDFRQSVNTMKLTLLSHHKLRERLDEYNQQT